MSAFSDSLASARKAAGMTQEELAFAIGVTRVTISSWERGLTQPDTESLRRLSEALNRDFLHESGTENTESAPPAGSKRRRRKTHWVTVAISCAILVVLAVCCFAVILPAVRRHRALAKLPPAVKAAAADLLLPEPEKYTASWFKQGNVRAEGEPWLEFDPSVALDLENHSEPFWHYALDFQEATGLPFTLDYVNEYIFWAEDEYHLETVPAASVWRDDEAPARWEYAGGMPVQDILCSGFLVVGRDAAGNRIAFRSCVDFTNAPRE